MTMLRQPYYELSPEIYNALVQASQSAGKLRAGTYADGTDLPAGLANQRLRLLSGNAQ